MAGVKRGRGRLPLLFQTPATKAKLVRELSLEVRPPSRRKQRFRLPETQVFKRLLTEVFEYDVGASRILRSGRKGCYRIPMGGTPYSSDGDDRMGANIKSIMEGEGESKKRESSGRFFLAFEGEGP